jgi:hypothetical protein
VTALVRTVLGVVRALELVVVVELELVGVVALKSVEVKMTFTLKAILLVGDVATKSKY